MESTHLILKITLMPITTSIVTQGALQAEVRSLLELLGSYLEASPAPSLQPFLFAAVHPALCQLAVLLASAGPIASWPGDDVALLRELLRLHTLLLRACRV